MAETKAPEVKLKSITIDTFTAFQKNEILKKWSTAGKAQYDDWTDYGTEILLFNKKLAARGFELVCVLGYEGTGKSYGMKTLDPGTNLWYNADWKNPTWTGGRKEYGTKENPTRYNVKVETYDAVIKHLDAVRAAGVFAPNPIAFLLAHIEDYRTVGGELRQRLKTFGKVANKMNIEDAYEICYYTEVKVEGEQTKYSLRTKNTGFNTGRTIEGMHSDLLIPNDFKLIQTAIENLQ